MINTNKQYNLYDLGFDKYMSKTSAVLGAIINADETSQLASIMSSDYSNATPLSNLESGELASKTIVLSVPHGTGDCFFSAGKTDFGSDVPGFILGIDDSDSDRAKFEIGDAESYMKYSPATGLIIYTNQVNGVIIDHASDILLREGGDINFTSVVAPDACSPALIATGTGNIENGDYQYYVTFITATGETELGMYSAKVTVDASHKQVALSNIPISTSPAVTGRNIYRKKNIGSKKLLVSINDNTTSSFTDNTADSSLPYFDYTYLQNETNGKMFIDGDLVVNIAANNLFIGREISAKSYGTGNIGVGSKTLAHLVQGGHNNVAMGYSCLHNVTSGIGNVGVGSFVLTSMTDGEYNIGIGNSALSKCTSGSNNIAIGFFSGAYTETGDNNIFIGHESGFYETGSNSLILDSIVRSSEADARAKSIIYGIMASTAAAQKLTINALLNLSVAKTPASAAATGIAGDIAWDTSYVYVCIAANTWKRVAIATW